MVYNFNLGIGWASSGVEYAESYRERAFQRLGIPARFIFADFFPRENIEHMTANLGFPDDDVIWIYQYFTGFPTAPVTFTKKDLERRLPMGEFSFSREGKIGRYQLPGNGNFWTVYFTGERTELVHRVEIVYQGLLIRKDYFTSDRYLSEYYAPRDNQANLYLRRFFRPDGRTAYEEILDGGRDIYRFPDQILYSKEEFVAYFVRSLHLTAEDTVLIDRTTGIGQAILENAGDARIGIVIHADHFSENHTDEQYILWNNYYEYDFSMHRHIDFYLTATDVQKTILEMQFEKYLGVLPRIVTIPVGNIDRLREPGPAGRKPYSIITASRLATEKHIDLAILAVSRAKEKFPELTFDIYGKGREEESLRRLIEELHAEAYIHLKGQADLTDVYRNYELYLSGSTSEGFGLSLLEAVGSGLPIVGFDVRYGNRNFIHEGKSGFLIPFSEEMTREEKIDGLLDGVVRYFSSEDRSSFFEASYEAARPYLEEEVMKRWRKLIE